MLLALMFVLSEASAALDDCPAPVLRSLDRGSAAIGAGRYEEAVTILEAAADECDAAETWQALGDAQRAVANRFQTDRDTGSASLAELARQGALEAYGNAFASARLARDDAAGALAARSIAAVGIESGDPLKAQNWLIAAERLQPAHPELASLQQRLDAAREELSEDEIETGLSQTRGIGMVNSLLGGKVSSNAFWDPEDEGAGGAGASMASVSGRIVTPASPGQAAATPADEQALTVSIDIPIRFDSDSTRLSAETAANVRSLANVLADQEDDTRITLTGHADTRGDAQYNEALSLARAEAIREILLAAVPSLAGRIEALGAGESQPLDPGDTPRAHANNRRLEVSVTTVP